MTPLCRLAAVFLLAQTTSAAAATSFTAVVKNDIQLACASQDAYSQAVNFLRQNDREAFQRFVLPELMSGRCAWFKEGERVFIEDTASFSGMVQIRRKGEPQTYWTARAAIGEFENR